MPSLTQQQINDIYSGIIAPQGGAYTPGPPVMLPPQQPLAERNAQLAQALATQPSLPSATGSFAENKDQSQLAASPPGNLFAYGSGMASTSPGASAIGNALIQGQPSASAPSDMNWETSNPGPAPQGDPWQGMNISDTPTTNRPGMVTSNRSAGLGAIGVQPVRSGFGAIGSPAATVQQPTAYQAALQAAATKFKTTPEAIHNQLMAQQTTSQTPEAQAAINAGQTSYTASKGSGVLGANALVATDNLDGSLHRSD